MSLEPDLLFREIHNGVIPLDVGTPQEFIDGHIPGSLPLPFDAKDLEARAKVLLPRGERYAIVGRGGWSSTISYELLAFSGFDVIGHLAGGFQRWRLEGRPVRHFTTIEVNVFPAPDIDLIDVREPHEFHRSHVPGARSVPASRGGSALIRALDERTPVVICENEARSTFAAAILERAGRRATIARGGMDAWALLDGLNEWSAGEAAV